MRYESPGSPIDLSRPRFLCRYLTVPRAHTTPPKQESGGHEQLHHTLQTDPTRHLRYDTHCPPNFNVRGPTRHVAYLQLPLPAVPIDCYRGRTLEAWN